MRGLFLEGLIFGRAFIWREICVTKSLVCKLAVKHFVYGPKKSRTRRWRVNFANSNKPVSYTHLTLPTKLEV